jgi:serine/threonine protein phosphatase PrpC
MLAGETQSNRGDSSRAREDEVPAAITDAGCERELNEDRYAVIESPSGLAWVVCDGMGGVAGGELAAQLAIDAMRRDLENMPVRTSEEALRSSILEANRVIVLRRQNPAFDQMGTTVVSALFSGPEVVLGNAGDSRAYLIRDGAIQQLTTDHTYVQGLVEKGHIKAEDALTHPEAHVLTKCLGAEPGLKPDLQHFWVWQVAKGEPVDKLMLCTDGLYSHITDGEMANFISQHAPQEACVKMVELAKSRGGYDNISLAVIPLGGQLRQEPPIGYDPEETIRRRMEELRSSAVAPALNIGRDILFIVSLSLLALFLTVLIMVFYMSQVA